MGMATSLLAMRGFRTLHSADLVSSGLMLAPHTADAHAPCILLTSEDSCRSLGCSHVLSAHTSVASLFRHCRRTDHRSEQDTLFQSSPW